MNRLAWLVSVMGGVLFAWGLVDMGTHASIMINGVAIPYIGSAPAFFTGTVISLLLTVGIVAGVIAWLAFAVTRTRLFLTTGSFRRVG